MKRCLKYFERLRAKQIERRVAGDVKWELSFLAPETWRNLRITCRGFFAYCRAIIDYEMHSPPGTIARLYGISVAHANSSVLEAWFSAVETLSLPPQQSISIL